MGSGIGLKSEGMVQGGGGGVYNWGSFKRRENIRHKAMGKGRSHLIVGLTWLDDICRVCTCGLYEYVTRSENVSRSIPSRPSNLSFPVAPVH